MSQSRSALLFPGLDALFVTKNLLKWHTVPYVQEKLKTASKYLSTITSQEEDLSKFLLENRRIHIVDFDRTLIVLTTIQVAVAELILDKVKWDIAQGCSHGDIARNVICGVLKFEAAIDILWVFSNLRKKCPEGYTASVRSIDKQKITNEQYEWLEGQKACVSTWSEENVTVGGDCEYIDRLSKEGLEVGLKIRSILSYPVHSNAMNILLEEILSYKDRWDFKNPKYKMFSSIWLRYIDSGKDAFEEGVAGAVNPVKWIETLKCLVEKEDVQTFINIGPSNTLTKQILEPTKFSHIKTLDAWDLFNGE
jgi:malonyl CoA-acyl carrier protein transacylase